MGIENTFSSKCEYGHDRYEDACEGIILTPEILAARYVSSGIVYRRHHNGGGLVATDSYVPTELSIPFDFTVYPNTRLLDNVALSGLLSTKGDYKNGTPVSRFMTDEDTEALLKQKIELGLPSLEEDIEYAVQLLATNGLYRVAID